MDKLYITFLDYNWKVHKDSSDCDHFPIVLENPGPTLDEKFLSWSLKKAD